MSVLLLIFECPYNLKKIKKEMLLQNSKIHNKTDISCCNHNVVITTGENCCDYFLQRGQGTPQHCTYNGLYEIRSRRREKEDCKFVGAQCARHNGTGVKSRIDMVRSKTDIS